MATYPHPEDGPPRPAHTMGSTRGLGQHKDGHREGAVKRAGPAASELTREKLNPSTPHRLLPPAASSTELLSRKTDPICVKRGVYRIARVF